MSKKNKIVYSNVQPNAKEAGVWVNTTDGNVKIEKDGKWVDDGGSSSGSGEASSIEYLDVSGFGMADDDSPSDELLNIVNAAICMKVDLGPEGKAVMIGGQFAMFYMVYGNSLYGMTKAVFIDYNLITAIPGRTMTVKEMLLGNFTQEQLDAIPRITKEEFYALT